MSRHDIAHATSVLTAVGCTVESGHTIVRCHLEQDWRGEWAAVDQPVDAWQVTTPAGHAFLVEAGALTELALDDYRRRRVGAPAAAGEQLTLGRSE